jgi:hypothetical protein
MRNLLRLVSVLVIAVGLVSLRAGPASADPSNCMICYPLNECCHSCEFAVDQVLCWCDPAIGYGC